MLKAFVFYTKSLCRMTLKKDCELGYVVQNTLLRRTVHGHRINKKYFSPHSIPSHVSSKCLGSLWEYRAFDFFNIVHIRRTLSTKIFYPKTENKFAHKILENSSLYSGTLAPTNYLDEIEEISEEEYKNILSRDWSNETVESVLLGFKKISRYSVVKPQLISNTEFDGLIQTLVNKCPQLNDEDLLGILSCLKKWDVVQSIRDRNFVELWEKVDNQCLLRMSEWDRDKVLYVADHWYMLNLTRFSKFMWRCASRLGRNADKLSPPHLVQCMFYINTMRKFPPHITIYDFEFSLEKCLDKLSIDEIGILAMGFFKSETPIRSQQLLKDMLRRICNEVDNIHEITLCALLKVVRYSLQSMDAGALYSTLDAILPHVNRLSILCCSHVALAGTNMQLFHERIFDKITQRFYNEMSNLRLKDLERFVFAISLFNYRPKGEPDIYHLIAEELQKSERIEEMKLFPKILPNCLHFLSLQQIFLKEEISKVLDKHFIVDVYGRNNHRIGREILSLDVTMELECPDYSGNRLTPKLRTYLSKIYTDGIWKYEDLLDRRLNATNRLLFELYTTCSSVLESDEKLHMCHIIPNRERADIVYGLCMDGSAVNIPSSYRELDFGTCKRPPDIPGVKWYCIIAGGTNAFIKNTRKPVGTMVSKLRQLQIVGYTPIIVPFYEWFGLSTAEQKIYISKMIYADFREKRICRVT